jgi:hypothetical protein
MCCPSPEFVVDARGRIVTEYRQGRKTENHTLDFVMLSGLSLRTRKLKYLSQTHEPNFMTNDPPLPSMHKLLSGRRK